MEKTIDDLNFANKEMKGDQTVQNAKIVDILKGQISDYEKKV